MIKDKIYPKTRDFPMSYNEDITLSIETIKIIGATSLWDVGCGNAAWSIWINKYLSGIIKFYLLDNFEYVNELNFETMPYWWPKNKTELIEHLDSSKIDYEFYETDIKNIPNKKVDYIRLDTDSETQETIAWCLNNLSENGIIQCCDIKINKSFDKIMLMTEQVVKGNLELVWLGTAEGVWCRPGNGEKIRKKLLSNKKLKEYFAYFNNRKYELMGKTHEYLRAKLKRKDDLKYV